MRIIIIAAIIVSYSCSAQISGQDSIRYMAIISYLMNNAKTLNKYVDDRKKQFNPAKMLVANQKTEFEPAFVIDSIYKHQSKQFQDSVGYGNFRKAIYKGTWVKDSSVISISLQKKINSYIDSVYKRKNILHESEKIWWTIHFSISYQNYIFVSIKERWKDYYIGNVFSLFFLFDDKNMIKDVNIRYIEPCIVPASNIKDLKRSSKGKSL